MAKSTPGSTGFSGDHLARRAVHEISYLRELIDDFGTPDCPPVNVALRKLYARYGRVGADIPRLHTLLADVPKEHLGEQVAELCQSLHAMLYHGLLVNAGQYRKATDPQGGHVHFGGMKGQSVRHRFTGSPPEQIAKDMVEACSHLAKTETPVASAILFYQRMSRVHPFYDANGRIGRLVVSTYLYGHKRYVNWREIDGRQGAFIQKLNACHKRQESQPAGLYERYVGYLTSFFRRYVEPHADFMEEGE